MNVGPYINEAIIDFETWFKSQKTWFDLESVDKKQAHLSTRNEGWDEPAADDIREGRRLVKLIQDAGWKASVEAYDEWVSVTVDLSGSKTMDVAKAILSAVKKAKITPIETDEYGNSWVVRLWKVPGETWQQQPRPWHHVTWDKRAGTVMVNDPPIFKAHLSAFKDQKEFESTIVKQLKRLKHPRQK